MYYANDHSMLSFPAYELISKFYFIYFDPERLNQKTAGAIIIKWIDPIIIVEYNELYDFLKLFWRHFATPLPSHSLSDSIIVLNHPLFVQ